MLINHEPSISRYLGKPIPGTSVYHVKTPVICIKQRDVLRKFGLMPGDVKWTIEGRIQASVSKAVVPLFYLPLLCPYFCPYGT